MSQKTTAVRTGKKKRWGEIGFVIGLMAIPVLHFLIFWLYINADSILMSFQQLDRIEGAFSFFKRDPVTEEIVGLVGFDNYRQLFAEFTKPGSVLPKALLNSFSVFLWNDFVIIPVSLFFAYILYKKVPLGNTFKVIFFLPSIISVVVLTLAFSYIFNFSVPEFLRESGIIALFERNGWDTEKILPFLGYFADPKWAWGMILFYGLWSGIGNNIVLMSGSMARIPEDVIEAGKIDGLNMLKEFWYVVIPLIGPTISTLLLMGSAVIFTYFLQPQLLLGANAATSGGYTIGLYIVSNVKEGGTVQMPMGATIGVMCALVGTPIVFLFRKALDKLFPAYEY